MFLDDLEIEYENEWYNVEFNAETTYFNHTTARITADPYHSEPAETEIKFEVDSIRYLDEGAEYHDGHFLYDAIREQLGDFIEDKLIENNL